MWGCLKDKRGRFLRSNMDMSFSTPHLLKWNLDFWEMNQHLKCRSQVHTSAWTDAGASQTRTSHGAIITPCGFAVYFGSKCSFWFKSRWNELYLPWLSRNGSHLLKEGFTLKKEPGRWAVIMRRAPRETVSSLWCEVQTFLDLCSLQVWVSNVQPVVVHVVDQISGKYIQMLLEFN